MPVPESETPDDTRTAIRAAVALGVVLTLGGSVLFDARIGRSVAVGATIGVLNLVAMRAIIRSLLRAPVDADADADAEGDSEGSPNDTEGGATTPSSEASPTTAGEGSGKGGAAWGVFALFKMLVLFGGIWILLTKQLVDPIALVVGYGVLPMGIALGAVLAALKPGARRR